MMGPTDLFEPKLPGQYEALSGKDPYQFDNGTVPQPDCLFHCDSAVHF